MSKAITCPTFQGLAVSLQTKTDQKRAIVACEIIAALEYIGAKSGQDAPMRRALDSVESGAPRNSKTGAITPNARRIITAARDAMTAGKLAYSRLQTANKLTPEAAQAYADECAVIVAEFMDKAWPEKAAAAPKVAQTPMDKARAAFAALSESERTALLWELVPNIMAGTAETQAETPASKPKRGKGADLKAA